MSKRVKNTNWKIQGGPRSFLSKIHVGGLKGPSSGSILGVQKKKNVAFLNHFQDSFPEYGLNTDLKKIQHVWSLEVEGEAVPHGQVSIPLGVDPWGGILRTAPGLSA